MVRAGCTGMYVHSMARLHYEKIEYRLIQLKGQCIVWSNIMRSSTMDSTTNKAMKLATDENDIPVASLYGRDLNSLKILEFKRCLICRNVSTRGMKAQLVIR